MTDRPFYCPRAKSPHHPCVVHDGRLAVSDDGHCVFCGIDPAEELKAVVPRLIEARERLAEKGAK